MRRRARMRQSAGRYDQLRDLSASPADIAEIVAMEFQDRVLAADMMRLRMSLGVPAGEIAQTAQLLLERAAPNRPASARWRSPRWRRIWPGTRTPSTATRANYSPARTFPAIPAVA